jgi:hypothetical protein
MVLVHLPVSRILTFILLYNFKILLNFLYYRNVVQEL